MKKTIKKTIKKAKQPKSEMEFGAKVLGKNKQKVFDYLEKHGEVLAQDIARDLNADRHTIMRHLNALQKENKAYMRKVGAYKLWSA